VIAPLTPVSQGHGALALSTYSMSKRFGSFTALDAVSIDVAAGSVHALAKGRALAGGSWRSDYSVAGGGAAG